MAALNENFNDWLSNKLQQLNTDESVFGSYIKGILDGDETADEKSEALREILSEIVENETEISEICKELLEKWSSLKPKEPPPLAASSEEVDTKLVKLLESQSLTTTKQRQYTEEEKKIKEAILSQYSQLTDDEADENEASSTKHPASGEAKESGLEKNMNATSVHQAEKVKREQAKLDSQKKKEKDKEDREKQKQQKEEKKEKRKTQKGERRR